MNAGRVMVPLASDNTRIAGDQGGQGGRGAAGLQDTTPHRENLINDLRAVVFAAEVVVECAPRAGVAEPA